MDREARMALRACVALFAAFAATVAAWFFEAG